jgi:glycosyltransferase involved in cell wall biosynthesis
VWPARRNRPSQHDARGRSNTLRVVRDRSRLTARTLGEMRVLIIEQRYDGGHYLNYVRYLVQAFAPLGCDIVIAVPEAALESVQFKVHLSRHRLLFRLEFIPPRDYVTSIWRTINADAQMFRELIDRVRPDAVYLPTGDGTAESLGLSRLALRPSGLSRPHCEVLLMRMPLAYGMSDRRRPPFLTKVALRAMPFDIVHYIDPVVFNWASSEVGGTVAKKARFIADPIEPLSLPTRSRACALLELPEHRKLIMSIGVQDHRKGVDYLIRACDCWKPAEPSSIVLAGRMSPPIREIVTEEYYHLIRDGRLIVLDRYLNDEEFRACFAAGDLIVAPYRSHPQPSGIVLHAVAAGKMVLAANNGWFAYMLPRFSLGRLCEAHEPEILAVALDAALRQAEEYELSIAAKRLLEFHRPENFMLQWRRELTRLMGRPEDTAPRDWTWVLNSMDQIPNR